MAVDVDTIATALGMGTPATGSIQSRQWEMWIADASNLIEKRRELLDVAPIAEADLDYVIREAVIAHIRRPDDATQVTISVDDASTSRTYRSSAGRVTIRDEWWQYLGLVSAGAGAFSVDTTPSLEGLL